MAKTRLKTSTADRQETDRDVDLAQLEALVGYNLRRAAARQRERFRSVFDAWELRPVLLTALTVIQNNMPLRQSDLGRALDIKRANVVKLLTELEDRGLVVRQPSARDRRSQVISLTDHGREMTQKWLDVHSRLEADLAHSFGEMELKQLVRLLQAFRNVDAAPTLD